ncbi:type I secretion system permease/ATPase [Pseudodonghicola xiamenensis]|uniref:Peptidase n=1 Tax=Pseudodonghicola xiamenensis TaxID=337702 RepID=A0A8J3MFC0_9RHOB|nr:type I secretion system permease/ATPase [Pseudodonghicola xiamenensis]GHH02199.1 peptidase [Pseudodonghicola xiamenensis]
MSETTPLKVVMRAVRRQLWWLLGLSLLCNLLLLTSSVYMLQIFDRVLSSGSYGTLLWLSGIAAAALLTFGLIELSRRQMLSGIGGWIERELSGEVMRRAMRQRLRDGRAAADTSDVTDLRSFLSGDALLAFLDAPWTPVFLAVIWAMHPLLGAIAVAGALILFALAVLNDLLTRQRLARVNGAMRRNRTDAAVYMEHAETLAALGMMGGTVARWSDAQRGLDARSDGARALSTTFLAASRSLRMIIQILMLGTGAYLVLQAELTAGGMIAGSIILSRALAPVERAIGAWRSYGSYREATARLSELFRQCPDRKDRLELDRPKGRIDVNGLRYHAPETGEPILKGLSFHLAAGSTLAIIGPSGSGKSSLCKCLVGAWPASFGAVRIDGADVAEWDSDDLGRHIGYLPQTVRLFSGSIAENIARLGPPETHLVLEASRRAGAHDLILSLPEGYETETGPYSDTLSGGQKQRIAMARALYGDPSVIALDEPDSNLDGNGELALAAMIRDLKERGKTVIFVSHAPALLRFADMVAVLKEGGLARFGPRDEILSSMMKPAPVKPRRVAEARV